jgi:flagellar biosynthesis protein FliQ
MNYSRIALAALGATVAYFVLGGILFAALPSLQKEFMKYPAVYRTQDDMKRVMPMGIISIFVGIVAVSVLYAMAYPAGGGVLDGARFGALIGVFAVCGFALHNHMLLNIGMKLTVGQAISYFVQWLVVGIVISLIYAPAKVS